jgi:hypothetical protein
VVLEKMFNGALAQLDFISLQNIAGKSENLLEFSYRILNGNFIT